MEHPDDDKRINKNPSENERIFINHLENDMNFVSNENSLMNMHDNIKEAGEGGEGVGNEHATFADKDKEDENPNDLSDEIQ